jgi:hypothetical protein
MNFADYMPWEPESKNKSYEKDVHAIVPGSD